MPGTACRLRVAPWRRRPCARLLLAPTAAARTSPSPPGSLRAVAPGCRLRFCRGLLAFRIVFRLRFSRGLEARPSLLKPVRDWIHTRKLFSSASGSVSQSNPAEPILLASRIGFLDYLEICISETTAEPISLAFRIVLLEICLSDTTAEPSSSPPGPIARALPSPRGKSRARSLARAGGPGARRTVKRYGHEQRLETCR